MTGTASVSRPPHTPFGRRLRVELDKQGLSARGLARRMRPDRVEDARRNIARWLAADAERSNSPSASGRREVAVALGLDENHFDDDEEEADPWTLMLRAVLLLREREQS